MKNKYTEYTCQPADAKSLDGVKTAKQQYNDIAAIATFAEKSTPYSTVLTALPPAVKLPVKIK